MQAKPAPAPRSTRPPLPSSSPCAWWWRRRPCAAARVRPLCAGAWGGGEEGAWVGGEQACPSPPRRGSLPLPITPSLHSSSLPQPPTQEEPLLADGVRAKEEEGLGVEGLGAHGVDRELQHLRRRGERVCVCGGMFVGVGMCLASGRVMWVCAASTGSARCHRGSRRSALACTHPPMHAPTPTLPCMHTHPPSHACTHTHPPMHAPTLPCMHTHAPAPTNKASTQQGARTSCWLGKAYSGEQ